jgi:ABC-type polysaccharide/polyol phosphate export permease
LNSGDVLIYLIFNFILAQWKFQFTNYKYIIALFFSTLVGVTVYWFTSQALHLTENFIGLNQDYFTYLLIGELILMLPLSLIESPARAIQYLNQEKMLEYFLTRPNPFRALIEMALTRSLIGILNIIFIVLIAKFVFGWTLLGSTIFLIVSMSFISFPLFLGIGIIFGSIILYYKRGYSIISQFSYLCSIIAGAYFPTQVFSEKWRMALSNLSPFNALLENLRLFVSGAKINFNFLFIYFDIVGLIVLVVSIFFLKQIFLIIRKDGAIESARLSSN